MRNLKDFFLGLIPRIASFRLKAMKTCPVCRRTFQDSDTTCPDDKSPLLESAPTDAESITAEIDVQAVQSEIKKLRGVPLPSNSLKGASTRKRKRSWLLIAFLLLFAGALGLALATR